MVVSCHLRHSNFVQMLPHWLHSMTAKLHAGIVLDATGFSMRQNQSSAGTQTGALLNGSESQSLTCFPLAMVMRRGITALDVSLVNSAGVSFHRHRKRARIGKKHAESLRPT